MSRSAAGIPAVPGDEAIDRWGVAGSGDRLGEGDGDLVEAHRGRDLGEERSTVEPTATAPTGGDAEAAVEEADEEDPTPRHLMGLSARPAGSFDGSADWPHGLRFGGREVPSKGSRWTR